MMDKGDNNIFEGEVTDRQILRRIDHTQLKPFATWSDIEQLCDEAISPFFRHSSKRFSLSHLVIHQINGHKMILLTYFLKAFYICRIFYSDFPHSVWSDNRFPQVIPLCMYHRRLAKLSGGQKRRCEIARALVNAPEIMFLDEPTTGLDPATRKKVWASLERLRRYFHIFNRGAVILLHPVFVCRGKIVQGRNDGFDHIDRR